jgi:hypothetical protein
VLKYFRPIYTHEGRGLERKTEKGEYVSIREAASEASAAPAESEHETLWAEIYPTFRAQRVSEWHKMSDKTSVHFTSPYSHKMDRKCTISGQLLPHSLSQLQTLYEKACRGAVEAKPRVAPPILSTSQPKPSGNSVASSRLSNQAQQGSAAASRARPASTWKSSRSNFKRSDVISE